MEDKNVKIYDYPEGYEKCKERLSYIPEDQRDSFMTGFMFMLWSQ